MMIVIHKACAGPAFEINSLESETCAVLAADFPSTCFTCLDEILEESEMMVFEEMRM